MVMKNRVSLVIPQETEDQAMLHMDGLIALFPELFDLSSEERIRLAKLSRRRQEMIDKVHIHAVQNPTLVPQYTDISEFIRDVESTKSLQRLNAKLEVFSNMVQDTIMLLQADAYEIGRAFYKTVQTAYKHGVPGTEKILADLSYHFKRKLAKKNDEVKTEGEQQTETNTETETQAENSTGKKKK